MFIQNANSGSMYNIPTISLSKSRQFLHETKTWNRLLEFFRQENAYLKNRLAAVVDLKTGKEFLVLAELFQNRFIINDEFIDELCHDINLQEDFFIKNDNTACDDKMIKKQDKFRNEMGYFENNFISLKNEFNRYLSTAL